jgi:hypothetical protein
MSVELREIGEAARSRLSPPDCPQFIFEQGQESSGQTLLNLASNANKFTEKGPSPSRLSPSWKKHCHHAHPGTVGHFGFPLAFKL